MCATACCVWQITKSAGKSPFSRSLSFLTGIAIAQKKTTPVVHIQHPQGPNHEVTSTVYLVLIQIKGISSSGYGDRALMKCQQFSSRHNDMRTCPSGSGWCLIGCEGSFWMNMVISTLAYLQLPRKLLHEGLSLHPQIMHSKAAFCKATKQAWDASEKGPSQEK